MTSSSGSTKHNYQPISISPAPKKQLKIGQLFQHRQALLGTSILAVMLLVWLAAGIGELSFAPGRPINFGDGEVHTIYDTLGDIVKQFSKVPFGQKVLFVGVFTAVTAISLILMPSELRKRMFKMLFIMAVTVFALLYFFNNFQFEGDASYSEELVLPLESIETLEGTGLSAEVFTPPQVSPVWNYVITLVLITLAMAMGWRLSRVWAKPEESGEESIQEFSRIAKTSLDDLSAGAQWEDVIMRSYMEMGNVVRDRRGIQRQQAMTPQEFADRLEKAGLPGYPVRRLTALFERVRYGTHSAGQNEVDEAAACLNAIASCFEVKP